MKETHLSIDQIKGFNYKNSTEFENFQSMGSVRLYTKSDEYKYYSLYIYYNQYFVLFNNKYYQLHSDNHPICINLHGSILASYYFLYGHIVHKTTWLSQKQLSNINTIIK